MAAATCQRQQPTKQSIQPVQPLLTPTRLSLSSISAAIQRRTSVILSSSPSTSMSHSCLSFSLHIRSIQGGARYNDGSYPAAAAGVNPNSNVNANGNGGGTRVYNENFSRGRGGANGNYRGRRDENELNREHRLKLDVLSMFRQPRRWLSWRLSRQWQRLSRQREYLPKSSSIPTEQRTTESFSSVVVGRSAMIDSFTSRLVSLPLNDN
jgi:hypothetical protein